MNWKTCLFTVPILALTLEPACRGDTIPPCPLPKGVSTVSYQDTPETLKKALAVRFGPMAQPGEEFDATDVVITHRNRRLIFIWKLASRWIVATEHGGRGYNDPILAYDITRTAGDPMFIAQRIAFPETVCKIVMEMLETN